jgi:hypothetical protein
MAQERLQTGPEAGLEIARDQDGGCRSQIAPRGRVRRLAEDGSPGACRVLQEDQRLAEDGFLGAGREAGRRRVTQGSPAREKGRPRRTGAASDLR